MMHTTCFDTPQPLIYHLKPKFCIFCHITSFTTPSASFNLIKLHQRIAFRYSFNINRVNMRRTIRFDTPKPPIYHHCTALKPIVRFLCHVTSYTTPSAFSISIKLHQRIAFRYSFNINIVNIRHTTRFDKHQPLIYHLCTAS